MSNYFTEADPARIVAEYPLGAEFERRILTMSVDELHELQQQRFLRVVARAWQIPFYQRLWRAAGLEPGGIRSLDDLTSIPVFGKSDIMQSVAECPPFGDFHGMDDLDDRQRRQVIVHTTSGTTGDPQPLIFGAFDREVQNALLARTYRMHGLLDSDVVHSVYGFGMVNGGHYVREAVTHFTRALLLTPGTGADMPSVNQVRSMVHFGTTVVVGFADYLLRLAEVARELDLQPGRDLKVRMLSGHIPAERAASLSAAWGGIPVHDWYGVGDTGVITASNPRAEGLVAYEDAHLLEILDPQELKPVIDGQMGNQCVTVLFKDTVYPIIRFDTQDLSSWNGERLGPLRCTSGFGGRSDNMVKLRGINVYPTAVAAFLSRWSEANGEYLCVVERLAGRDHMTIQVEWGTPHDGTTSDGVAAELSTLLGVSVDVTLCAPEATAELTGIYARQKPKRLLDNRND